MDLSESIRPSVYDSLKLKKGEILSEMDSSSTTSREFF